MSTRGSSPTVQALIDSGSLSGIRAHEMHGRGEAWLSEGVAYIRQDTCPFCSQPLAAVIAVTELRKERDGLAGAEGKLTEAFSLGTISPSAYRERTQRLRLRRTELNDIINGKPLSNDQLAARVGKTLELATSLWDYYLELDDERRSGLLRSVFRTVVLGPEGILGFALNSPFDQLQSSRGSETARIAETLIETLAA